MFSLILIRITDYFIAITSLIIFAPLILLISLLVIFLTNHPIFYISLRVGKNGKLFKIYKFQTMIDQKITFLGFYMRRLSPDEIPQFINVIKGDMSIVGPRPLPADIENNINKDLRYQRRLIRLGITGLTQLKYSGKKRTLEEKINTDILYLKNLNYIRYLKIIIFTFPTLIRRFNFNKYMYFF